MATLLFADYPVPLFYLRSGDMIHIAPRHHLVEHHQAKCERYRRVRNGL